MDREKIINTALTLFFLCLLSCELYGADLLIINSQMSEPYISIKKSMFEELKNHGFIKGKNLNVKEWSLGNIGTKVIRVLLEEKNNRYDAVVFFGTIAAVNLQKYAENKRKYRFVFGAVTDPIGLKLIEKYGSRTRGDFKGVCYTVEVRERLRFIMEAMPDVRNIGLIYTRMPQSITYLEKLNEALKEKEFRHLKFHLREIDFVKSELGYARMAMLAKRYVKELDKKVDIFMSPHDQMGIQKPFVNMVSATASKPLIGLGKKDVGNSWGATMSISIPVENQGRDVAEILLNLFKGVKYKDIKSSCTGNYEIAVNTNKLRKFNIKLPKAYLKRKNVIKINR